ncbi:MAG: PfkB family carbohydrate kinase [Flavisolibacter sp.]
MNKVLCFGELLLRLSPQLHGEWIRQNSMPVFVGGAELNAATALARWGIPVSYCTALPDHYLSREILEDIKLKGIDTSRILFSGSRIGTYYLPQGADLKHAGVIYDRAHSSFWDLKPGQINWENLLEGIHWLHLSAISPALNEEVAMVCAEAAEAASVRGLTVSIDLNYRSKLWQYGKEPSVIMNKILPFCNVVMGNIWSKDALLGIGVDADIHDKKSRTAYLEHARRSSEKIIRLFPKVNAVANTFRFEEGGGIRYYACLDTEFGQSVSDEFFTDKVVDRVGSGDTFMAGLIYGYNRQLSPQEIIRFSAAAAFNKLFIKGDATTASAEEIMKGHLHYA